ncbi:MAG: hypothetical protein HRU09_03105, partial [Oligoflexales bacterium]|nr:hypothetical protein [Oligoflexales bacterium]
QKFNKLRLEFTVFISIFHDLKCRTQVLSLSLLSCGQIKQKQSKAKERDFKLLAKAEEPRKLELDEASIYKVLNQDAEDGSDRHCQFMEKAVSAFNKAYLSGVDYFAEQCEQVGEQKRELRFKMERKL